MHFVLVRKALNWNPLQVPNNILMLESVLRRQKEKMESKLLWKRITLIHGLDFLAFLVKRFIISMGK